MFKTILATATAATIAATIAMPAHAGAVWNGFRANGLVLNGLVLNGFKSNSLSLNGVEQGAGTLVLEAIELPPKAE